MRLCQAVREFAFDAANVFDDARTVSHNYTRETEQYFQCLVSSDMEEGLFLLL